MRSPRVRLRAIWLLALAGLVVGGVTSCGSRTGLFGTDDDSPPITEPDADARRDGSPEADAAADVVLDVPMVDVRPKPDVDRTDCPDADATFIYVVSDANELFSFYPPTLSFKFIGNLVCPAAPGQTPFSMAVDRRGVAYVLYDDVTDSASAGSLFRVSTATAACAPTTFTPNQEGFSTFGMGFSSDVGGAAERLYVTDNHFSGFGQPSSRGLGSIDTTTFKLSFIGPYGISIPRAELTGTGDGRLFAYWPDPNTPGAHLSELDKASGAVVAQTNLSVGGSNDAFAFAFWGGEFWIFTSGQGGPTSVSRFNPVDGTTTLATTLPSIIVGAGVSTCAPQL